MRGKHERNTPKAKKIHRTASRLAASSGDAFVLFSGFGSSSAAVVAQAGPPTVPQRPRRLPRPACFGNGACAGHSFA